jgi:hypothetical protein
MEGPVFRHDHWQADAKNDQAAERQTASLAAVVVVLMLLVGGLFLVQHLRAAARTEDCLLSGRRNCDTLVVHHH